MPTDRLRQEIREFLQLSLPPNTIPFETRAVVKEHDYDRLQITYDNEEHDRIPAFLLMPHGAGPFPALLVHHQHNSQWHLGKSEVCGLAGDHSLRRSAGEVAAAVVSWLGQRVA